MLCLPPFYGGCFAIDLASFFSGYFVVVLTLGLVDTLPLCLLPALVNTSAPSLLLALIDTLLSCLLPTLADTLPLPLLLALADTLPSWSCCLGALQPLLCLGRCFAVVILLPAVGLQMLGLCDP